MTSSLKAVLSSTALFCAVGCSTGPSPGNVPQEPAGSGGGSGTTAGTGAGSGTAAGTGAGSGTAAGTGAGSGTAAGTGAGSGTAAGTGAGSGTAAGTGATSGTGSGSTSGATGSASGTAGGSGSGAASGSAGTPLSFALDVYSDLGLCTTCLPCHAPPNGNGYATGKLDLSTSDNAYVSLLGDAGAGAPAAGASCGGKNPALIRVVPGNAVGSLLYNKLNAKTTAGAKVPCGSAMPLTGNALSVSSLGVIEQWINSGAKP
jgi:hypothetical protein